ncbi:hypothetical protein [Kaistia sp. MMO-174]|uniref:hypothetical protein n=1 Tax=Kaistia sp. MMO-174 TaxID=3081256 RepID=UPI00301B53A9
MTAAQSDPIKLLRDLLKIGRAVMDCGRCEALAASEIRQLSEALNAAELRALTEDGPLIRHFEAASIFLQALSAIERHHEVPHQHERWTVLAEAAARLVRADIDWLIEARAAAEVSP